MAHLLYRPHIDHGDKIVTTDFLIREIGLLLPMAGAAELLVDLASTAIELAVRDGAALVAPALFGFVGDGAPYAAPAVAVLDPRLNASEPVLAWENARVSIARWALPLSGRASLDYRFGEEAPQTFDSGTLDGFGRFRGAVHPCGDARPANPGETLTLEVSAGVTVRHHLTLTPLIAGGAK